MLPARFALTICLFVPLHAAYSQTTDQLAPAKISPTEFRAISTKQLSTFEKELSELAGQGFRLERLLESATVMYQAAVLSRQQPEGAATKYEYKLLATRNISAIQKELDAAASEGYEVCGAMSAGKLFVGTDMVLVLGRLAGEKTQRVLYRILTTNSDREVEFSDSLHKFVSDGYRPIKLIHQIDVGMGALIRPGKSTFLAILSRKAGNENLGADDTEYRFLAAMRTSTMEKEINQAAKEGYRLSSTSLGRFALMARDKRNSQASYEYKFHKLEKQAGEQDLLTYSHRGFNYRATVTGAGGPMAVLEHDLQAGANIPTQEYKLLKFPNKEEEKEKFQKEMSEAVASGFRFLDLTAWERLAVILVR
jgi:hypothetical protein